MLVADLRLPLTGEALPLGEDGLPKEQDTWHAFSDVGN